MADNPIKVKAYGKILNFPAGTTPEAIESALAEHEHVLNPEYKTPQPEALDYAKGFASGANKLVSGAGFLAEAAGAKETGKAIRAFGDRGAKYWNDKMSKGGKLASESQVFVDDDNEDSVTGIKLSDDWGKALLMGASQSLPSMFAAAIPGVAVTKGIQALAKLGLAGGAGATIPLLAGTAAPVGVTSNIIARVPSAVGFGAAEGVTAGAMNAADFKTSIEGMTDEELNKSPVYRALKEEHDPETARGLLAEQAAIDLFGKTAVSTGTIGALTGGGALSQAYQKVTTGAQSGILGTMLKGAGSEALQETPQSGGEKFIENLTTQKFLDPDQSTTEGVLAAAASGGAIGAFTGGVVGAGGAINITPDRRAQVLNEKRKIAEMKAEAVNARTMEESAADINAAQDIDQVLAAATRATAKPVVSANEVLRSEDPTLADIEKLTGLKPTEAIDTAIDEIENPIIDQLQETENVSNQEERQAPTTQAPVLNADKLPRPIPVTSGTTAEVEGVVGGTGTQADIGAAVKTAEDTSTSPVNTAKPSFSVEGLTDKSPVMNEETFKAKGIAEPYSAYLKAHPNKTEAVKADTKYVENKLLQGLQGTGKFDDKTNQAYATPFREFYKVNAERQGIMPSELYERLPLKFKGSQDTGEVLKQGEKTPTIKVKGIDRPTVNSEGKPIPNPEKFHEWFGDSKVVDNEGRPLTVYHGTQSDFSTFDQDSAKSVSNTDIGYFFTKRAIDASDHAEADWFRDGPQPNVMPVHLQLLNPERVEGVGQPARWYDNNGRELALKAMKEGKDGLIIGNGNNDLYVAFKNTQIKSAIGNSGEFNPNDPNILKQKDRAGFNPRTFTISLMDGSDLSSVIHEGGHFYLEALAEMASQPNAPEQIVNDFDTTLKWFGVEKDAWQSMPLDKKRPYHEQWAQSFERYALEGKSPSKEMQSVFDRFQEWMLDVYKSLKEFLKQNPLAGKLNDEVRSVFDRLLATEQDIAKSREAPTKERSLKNGERAKQLERKLREQGYEFTITAKDVRDFAAGDRGKEIEANTAEKIAGIFGRKIVWIDAQGDYDINGVVVPSIKDTIFIDVNTDKAAHAVMGHELSHHLEHDNPDVYDDLLDALSTVIKDHQGYAKKYGIEGVRKDDITKEIVGDIMGDNFTKPEFWNRVAEANPSTFKSIADSIIKWLKNLILKAKSRGLGSDQWVTDSQKAQDILAKAIAKYEGLNDSVAEGGAKFHKVWHGSPHDHSKFDSTKIGTGEGAQAYGYGHYFADRKEVAEYYKEQLSDNTNGPPERFFRGVKLTPGTPEYHAATLLSRNNISTLRQARNEVANWISEDAGDPRMSDVVEGWRATLDFLNNANSKKDFTEKPYRGKLYEVELAPKQEDYLLWDKPLSEQSEKVKSALDARRERYKEVMAGIPDVPDNLEDFKKWDSDNDAKLVEASKLRLDMNQTGQSFYRNLDDDPRAASEYLHSLGIRGIKYLDGTSRSQGEGAYNYVVFDDKDIEITAKFSKKAVELKLTKADMSGTKFETGKPVTFNYMHNKDSATSVFGRPKKDSRFNRYYDPSGKYVTFTTKREVPDYGNFEIGSLTFNNPLVIENDNLEWKKDLSNNYGGLRGKALSQAVIADGYDGIVTVDKSSSGESYTSEILDLTTFDESIAKFSKKAAENTLIVQHNLTVKNLLHADRMGGLAAPSIAVTDKSHPLTGFGEITLLADKDLIDPQKGAKIFGSDIYSPRYPQLSYDFVGKPIEKLKTMLADGIAKTGDSGFYNDNLQDDPFRELLHSSAAMHQFLTEQGKKPKIVYVKPKPLSDPDLKPFLTFKGDSFDLSQDEKFRAAVKNIFETKKDYKLDDDGVSNMSRAYAEEVMRHRDAKKNTGKLDRQFTNSSLFRQIGDAKLMNKFENYLVELINKVEPKERIFQGYTNSGNRRYLPHDIDTVVKLLQKDLRGGENFKYGLGSVRAKYSKQFKSIEQIRNSKNSLMSSEDFDAVKKEVNAELDTLSEALNKYGTFSGFDNVENMLSDAAKLGINRALKENGFENVPDRLKINAQNFLNKLKDMPTEYFEAKLLRRVNLGEFTAAVVPKDTPAQALEILKNNGITDIRKYKSGDKNDRIAQIGKLDRVMFSRKAATARFSFAGRESETADVRSLETAQARIEAGDNAEAVRRETGWFKGVDDKWRYEINDKDASLKKPFNKKRGTWYSTSTPVPMSRWTLGNVLDHPALYAAYPMLKDVRIGLTRTGQGGQFSPKNNMINIGGAEKMEDVKSILLHEIQHGIQNLEDFARGGSPSKFEAKPEPTGEFKEGLTALLDLDRLSKQFNKTYKEVLETGAINEPFASTFLSKTEGDLDYLIKQAKSRTLTPYEKYRRLAGEVESRTVQARLEMDEDERRSIPPSASQDTPDSEVIVTFNGKDMESAPPPANAEPFDPNTDIPETLPRKAQRLAQDAFNRFTVIQNWLKEKGVTLSEKADVYQAEERYHSLVANQLEDFREQKRNPLIEKIANAGFTMADVSDFLEAQHAAEANAAIQKISNNDTDTAYGITDEEAADYLAKADPKLAKLANELRDITEESKQMRLKAGLLSQEEVDAWESTYEHYIPVKGDADAKGGTGKGLKVNFKTKRRLGHGKRDEAVVENILLDHERAIMQVEKNRVAKHLVMMAAEMQMPEIMTVGQPVKRKTLRNTTAYEVKVSGVTRSVFNNKQAADMFKQLLPDLDKGVSPNDITVEQTKDQRIVAMASPMLAENEINAYIDGHAIRVQINDDLLARAYAKLGVTGFSALVSAGRAFNGYLSKVYTGYNPEFIVTNMIRDFTSGLINLTGEEGLKMAAKASGNYVKSFSSLMSYAVSNGKKSDKWIDMYRANGGNTGAAYLSDLERLGDEVKTEYAAYQGVMANLKSGSFVNASRAAGRKVFNLTLKWIYNLNQAGENAMRLAAFRAMIESGKTPAQAAKAAKNITVNFNRKGELGAEANAAYLFFNASVQGVAALAHAHFKGKNKYQAWGLSSMVGVLGYMSAVALLGGDDDEYDKLNDYTKSRNLLIKAGEGYAQIPIPYGYGFFWNMGRSIAEAQHKGELGVLPWHIAASAIEELTPFSDTVVGTQDGFHFDQVLLGLLPTVIKIPAQPAFNKQLFSGSELMPDSAFQQFQPDREKLWRATQGTMYDRMSGWLDEAIGADVSPETLKHYTRTFTGGAGAMVDATVSAAMLKKEGAELEPSEIPFVRKAYSKLTIREHRAAYYKAREEAKKTAEEFTRAKARNDITAINKLVKDEAEMIGLDAYANKLSKAISAMRDMQDAIRLDEGLNAAEKRVKIKELEITEQKFYDQYLDVFKIEKMKMKARND